MIRTPQTLLCCVALGALSLAGPAAANTAGSGAEFKAAVVYNFARFASWPPTRFTDASAPVVLCVAPAEPLAPALLRLEGRPVGTRRLHVRVAAHFGVGCHLAYVTELASAAEMAALHRQGILTVSDAPSFSRVGAIGLVSIGRQVRFEVNTAAARDAGVKLSAQLMRLAVVVR